jgi:hypothetical protein
MDEYNIIPMGDNCIVAETLKDLGLRKCSYPFDWISHVNYFTATNINYNFEIVEKLIQGNFLVKDFVGITQTNKIHKNIWFPHDNEATVEETLDKYERRFARLHADIVGKKNIFVFLTRHYIMEESAFDKIVAQVLSYNRENKIVYMYGSNHPYMHKPKYKMCVAYQHLEYDVTKLTPKMEYEYEYYRPWVKNYLSTLFDGINHSLSKSSLEEKTFLDL